jgi:hypothetical protein
MNPYSDLRRWNFLGTHIPKEKSDATDYLGLGKIVYDKVVKVKNFNKNVALDVPIDLTPALEEGNIGQVGIVVCPTQKGHYPNDWSYRTIVKAWIQVLNVCNI